MSSTLKVLSVINSALDLISVLENSSAAYDKVSALITKSRAEGRKLTDAELKSILDDARTAIDELDAELDSDYEEGDTSG